MIANDSENVSGGRMSLLAALFWFSLAMLLTAPVVIWGWHSWHGTPGLAAAIAALTVCWLAGFLALVITSLFAKLGNPVAGIMGSMMFRMGLPLGACVVGLQAAPKLMEAGLPLAIVAFYAVALVVETTLSLRVAAPSSSVK